MKETRKWRIATRSNMGGMGLHTDAVLRGGVALHMGINKKGWAITHVASGCEIFATESCQIARIALRRFSELMWPNSAPTKQQVRAIQRGKNGTAGYIGKGVAKQMREIREELEGLSVF